VVPDQVGTAVVSSEHTCAFLIVPDVAGGAKTLEATAATDINVVVEVESDWAWLLLAQAKLSFVVPELSAFAFLRYVSPFAVDFVPSLVSISRDIWQADAIVAPVVPVEVRTAITRSLSALAP
jgi:hypothetical protein